MESEQNYLFYFPGQCWSCDPHFPSMDRVLVGENTNKGNLGIK